MSDGTNQREFLGVCIYPDFQVKMLEPGSSFDEIIKQVDMPLKEYKLLEENVETLLIGAFQYIFKDFDSMLISRERPLLKVADLIAIDQIGRLTVFEIKKDKPKSVEIVAQAMRYLVECANLTAVEIRRLFRDFYLYFSVFQVLSFAGLLARCGVERGLKSYLKSYLPENERKKLDLLSKSGGDEYFNYLKDASIKYILRPRNVDIESIGERLLRQATGISDISLLELDKFTVDFDRMFERRFKVKTEKVAINRQWRIVFFAPTYSFDHEIRQYLTWMYIRGMDMLFYEYRLMASSQNGPWLLSWRERRDWLDEELLEKKASKSFKQWKAIESWLNEFITRTAREGYILKKMAGLFEYWNVIEPDLRAISVKWPNRKANDLSKGKIFINGITYTDYCIISNKLGAIHNRYNGYDAKITFQEDKNRVVIEWKAHNSSLEDCVEVASKVVVGVSEAIKNSLAEYKDKNSG